MAAVVAFCSTINTGLWGHPWAETAQDIGMFGGPVVMLVTGIGIVNISRRSERR